MQAAGPVSVRVRDEGVPEPRLTSHSAQHEYVADYRVPIELT